MTYLEKWNYFFRDFESPQQFIDWTFYYMIGAALERRVWCFEPEVAVYPNMFVVFIGPSRIGKSATAVVMKKEIFKKLDYKDANGEWVELIKRGPDSLSLPKLVQYMHENFRTVEVPSTTPGEKGTLYVYSSMAFIAASELGTLFSTDTSDLIRFLTEGWECGDFDKKLLSRDDSVKNMCISLFGAATPEWLRESIKSSLFGEGFAARTIFVYGDAKRKLQFDYRITPEQRAALDDVREHVRSLTEIYGQMDIPEHVMAWLREWYTHRNRPLNPDRKLVHYYGNKKLHLTKMAMIVHFARTAEDMTLTIEDCEEALRILNRTEIHMGKALSGVGSNPLAELTALIEQHFIENKRATHRELSVKYWDEFPSKNITDLQNVLHYLLDAGVIFEHKIEKGVFFLAEREMREKAEKLETELAEQLRSAAEIKTLTKISSAPPVEVKPTTQSTNLTMIEL